MLPSCPVTPVRRKFPQGYHLRDHCAQSRRPCAGLPAGGQLIAPVTERSRVGGVHRRADHRVKTWVRAADTVSLPAGKSASSAAKAAISSSCTVNGQQCWTSDGSASARKTTVEAWMIMDDHG